MAALAESLSTTGAARRISATLVVIPVDRSEQLYELIKGCLKLDAMILVGSLNLITDPMLNSIADILSYPSMLDGLLKSETNRLPRKLAEYADCLIFESVSPRAIKLLLPALSKGSE
jgi:hypothetical protein